MCSGAWKRGPEIAVGWSPYAPCHCTSMGQNGSNKFEMAQIDQAVAELQHPQEFGFATRIQKGWMGQWSWCCTSVCQDSSTELEMEQISPAVAELQWPQEFGCLTGISGQAWQANDHVIAYLWVKTVPQNLRWNEWLSPMVVELQCPQPTQMVGQKDRRQRFFYSSSCFPSDGNGQKLKMSKHSKGHSKQESGHSPGQTWSTETPLLASMAAIFTEGNYMSSGGGGI